MDKLTEDIERQAKELEEFLAGDLIEIIAVEGINHIEEAFDNEGFTDSHLQKWEKRKTTDKKGRDITRYRTNRRGKKGRLNKYGRNNKGRAVLTGHNTGGDKLRNSYRATELEDGVEFHTDKEYAERHNEGDKDMPKRQHVGESEALNKKIEKKIDKHLDKIFQ